eukprot:TRINITY_DN18421_c0_g1_i1.p1 TRINITY_DN18421_c0_g1~~TRINITY_DN18421_c0_g1_i1.p1  ORF type:complete len:1235 (+),score=296.94 TRINITY_DN18421_c0_g1_i1:97-3801(+)
MDVEAKRLVELAAAAAGDVTWGRKPAARPTTAKLRAKAPQGHTTLRPQSARVPHSAGKLSGGAQYSNARRPYAQPQVQQRAQAQAQAPDDAVEEIVCAPEPPAPTGFVDVPPPGPRCAPASPPVARVCPPRVQEAPEMGGAVWWGGSRRPATGGAARGARAQAWGHQASPPNPEIHPASPRSDAGREPLTQPQPAAWGLQMGTRVGAQRPRTAPSARAQDSTHQHDDAGGKVESDVAHEKHAKQQARRHQKTMQLARRHEKARLEMLERARRNRDARNTAKARRQARRDAWGKATVPSQKTLASILVGIAAAVAAQRVGDDADARVFTDADEFVEEHADAEMAEHHTTHSVTAIEGTLEVSRDCVTPLLGIQVSTRRVSNPTGLSRQRPFAGGGGAMWLQAVRRDDSETTTAPTTPVARDGSGTLQRVRFSVDDGNDSAQSTPVGKRLAGLPARSLRGGGTEGWFAGSAESVQDDASSNGTARGGRPQTQREAIHNYRDVVGSAHGSEENGPSSSPSAASSDGYARRGNPVQTMPSTQEGEMGALHHGAWREVREHEHVWGGAAGAEQSLSFFMKRPARPNLAMENKDDVDGAAAMPNPACRAKQKRLVLRRAPECDNDLLMPAAEVRAPLVRDLALEELASFFEVRAGLSPAASKARAMEAYDASNACPRRLKVFLVERYPLHEEQFACVDEWRDAEDRAAPEPPAHPQPVPPQPAPPRAQPKPREERREAADLLAVQEGGGVVRIGGRGGDAVLNADPVKKVSIAMEAPKEKDGGVEETLCEAGRVRKLSLGGQLQASGGAPMRAQELRREELLQADPVRFLPPGYDGRVQHIVDCTVLPHDDGMVDEDWATGVRTQHHATLAAAVAATGPGDTITIRPGTYEESVTLTHPLQIRGEEGGARPILQCPTPRPALHLPPEAGRSLVEHLAFTTRLADTVQDAIITGSDGVVCIESQTAELCGCAVTAYGGHGVVVRGNSSALVENCSVKNVSRGGGIHVLGHSQPILRGNTISGCGDCAVVVEGVGTRPLVVDNKLVDGRGGGIVFSRRCGGTAEGNVIARNKCVGVIVDSGAAPYVTRNTVARNEGGGVRVTGLGTRGRVHKNILDRNDEQGLLVTEEAKPHLVANRIIGSRSGVVWTTGAGGVLEQNHFDRQAVYCGVTRSEARPTCLGNIFAYPPHTGGFYACDGGRAYLQENQFLGAMERSVCAETGGSATLKLNSFGPYRLLPADPEA